MILKFIERSMWFFPAILIGLIFRALIELIHNPTMINFFILIFLTYLLPPLLYRVISFFAPLHPGKFKLGPEHPASVWMIAHRLQLIYHIFPSLEKIMRSIPGPYTWWLRLWGSKVGRRVFFTPDCHILDRTHMEIGDGTFIGSSTFSCHMAVKKGDLVVLSLIPIKIGSNAFISAQCNLGPGAVVADGETLKIMTQILGNRRRQLIE
jgi:hypothetical protein